MKFLTESGSAYEIKQGRIRRLNTGKPQEHDGAWLTLVDTPHVEKGLSVRMMLRTPLPAPMGLEETSEGDPFGVTSRVTTPVVEVSE